MFSLSFLFLLCWLCPWLPLKHSNMSYRVSLYPFQVPSTKNHLSPSSRLSSQDFESQVAKNSRCLLENVEMKIALCGPKSANCNSSRSPCFWMWKAIVKHPSYFYLLNIFELAWMYRRSGPAHMLLHTKLTWVSFPLWNPSPSPVRLRTHQRYHLYRFAAYLFLHSGPK